MSNELRLTSASQISVYRDECKRKWALKSIAKLETPAHASAKLGTEVDDEQLQPYLRDGRTFDYTRDSGYIAASALAYLPEPKTPGLVLQKKFEFYNAKEGFGYVGYKDLWHPDSRVMPEIPPPPDGLIVPLVGDFKTTSNLKWQKSETTLATDVQAMLYAYNAMRETRVPVVDLAWIYMQTKGTRKAKRTHLRVVASHVKEQFDSINEVAIRMLEVRKQFAGLDPIKASLELEPNADMCEAYGGCPFRNQCNLAPSVFTEAVETTMEDGMSFMERLKKQRAATLGQAEAVQEAPEPVTKAVEVVGINPPESALVDEPVTFSANFEISELGPEIATSEPAPKKRGRGPSIKKAEAPPEASAPVITMISNNATTSGDDTRLLKALTAAAHSFLMALGE